MNETTAALIETYPTLKPLVNKLDHRGNVTKAFVEGYLRSRHAYGRKSALLQRVLFNEAKVVGRQVSVDALEQIARFLIHHPNPLLTDPACIDGYSIPATIKASLGLSIKCSWSAVCLRLADMYVAWRHNQLDRLPKCVSVTRKDDLSFLGPFYRASLITTEVANEILTSVKRNNQRKGIINRFFFKSDDQARNIRNMLVFYLAFLKTERKKGILQNRIPICMTEYFGIRRLSISELMLAFDVLTLAYFGVIDPGKVPVKQEFLSLRDKLEQLNQKSAPEDIKELMSECVNTWLMTDDSAEDLLVNRDINGRFNESQYETSMWFNVDRMVHREKFQKFGVYYDEGISTRKMTRLVHDHYRKIDQEYYGQIKNGWKQLNANTCLGIRRRDIANCLYYLHANEIHNYVIAGNSLPSVGRYTLGQKEPKPTSKERKGKSGITMSPKGSKGIVYYFQMPVLDRLWSNA